jgi:hypothetical protein
MLIQEPSFPNALHQRLRANEAVSGRVKDLGQRVTGLDTRVTDAQTTAETAKTEAAEAKTQAGEAKTESADAKITAAEAKTTADEAKTESSEANTTAAEAKSIAETAKTEVDEVGKELGDRVGGAAREITLASLQQQAQSHDSRIEELEKRQPPSYDLNRFVASMLLSNLVNEWRNIIAHTPPGQRHQVFSESLKSNLYINMERHFNKHLSQDWQAINKEITELRRKPKKDWSEQVVDPGISTTMAALSDSAAKLWMPA